MKEILSKKFLLKRVLLRPQYSINGITEGRIMEFSSTEEYVKIRWSSKAETWCESRDYFVIETLPDLKKDVV